VQAGMTRREAMRALAARADVGELRSFITAVVQADHYGVPIGQVLRVQGAELRLKRSQRAEEKAMKLPVKLLFPTIAFIFPVLFIVLLGPAVLQISRSI
jgi:tight adherence protein C